MGVEGASRAYMKQSNRWIWWALHAGDEMQTLKLGCESTLLILFVLSEKSPARTRSFFLINK